MDWNQIRRQWQQDGASGAPDSDDELIASVRQRDAKLRKLVLRRDWLETAVAIVVAPIFAYAAWRAGWREAWWPMAFSAWLALWAIFVPWNFWRVRRRMTQPRSELPLIDYLRQAGDAMRDQARMLEQIWFWYLAPCAVGVIGLVVSGQGLTTGSLSYAVFVLVFCLLLGWLNRRAARTHFRDLAAQIDHQLTRLIEENER